MTNLLPISSLQSTSITKQQFPILVPHSPYRNISYPNNNWQAQLHIDIKSPYDYTSTLTQAQLQIRLCFHKTILQQVSSLSNKSSPWPCDLVLSSINPSKSVTTILLSTLVPCAPMKLQLFVFTFRVCPHLTL